CLGMQLLARHSEEGDVDGLAWLPATVRRLQPNDQKLRVPHIGWNELNIRSPGKLLAGVPEDACAYFVHSFYLDVEEENIVSATTDHGGNWTAVIESGGLFGAQFHPEKSDEAGLIMLRNFSRL
ncbi:MAG: imidazole glycerol phosphate synthase subunit HisH, partial [Pirellulaceae bacterium]|nr:imidazole glycerol phosphate synthase subunit HisH [Pirellulaceae bacterium]